MKAEIDINRIIIVGGGTAGWMATCYLQRFLSRVDSKITLIESPSIETIGVGEATLPTIVRFLRNMGFDEQEFMRECKATYKLGINFHNWVRKDHNYWHPFGVCGSIIDGIDLFHFWINAGRQSNESYSDYSLQAQIAENGKAPNFKEDVSKIIENGAYAYHLDAGEFANYLKGKAVSSGVEHVFADVDEVSLNSEGAIDYLTTKEGNKYEADLYIDCTGFHGRLISEAMKVAFIDWSEYLLCNKAVALSFEKNSKMNANTNSVALEAGWSWQIPLSDRLGCGYVYSSDHKNETEALDELMDLMSDEYVLSDEPKNLTIPVGHRSQFWKGNCLSLGLAGGFLEPLESTGIHLIQYGIETFMDYFPDRKFDTSLTSAYNKKMTSAYEESRDFLMLHYYLSQREDTEFWNDCRSTKQPVSLEALLNLYDESGVIETMTTRAFPATSYFHILSGGERYPRRPLAMTNVSDLTKVNQIMLSIKERNLVLTEQSPDHKMLIDLINS
ncbi:MAG: tryptophan 7-halogenase [Gammaproteobacteria bacterium]|jgi:tryptophan 7-halogenase|nr:tryptophan 7-halogenase [Gammaproteobacteria bacterium]